MGVYKDVADILVGAGCTFSTNGVCTPRGTNDRWCLLAQEYGWWCQTSREWVPVLEEDDARVVAREIAWGFKDIPEHRHWATSVIHACARLEEAPPTEAPPRGFDLCWRPGTQTLSVRRGSETLRVYHGTFDTCLPWALEYLETRGA
jgi:hypothetical protein